MERREPSPGESIQPIDSPAQPSPSSGAAVVLPLDERSEATGDGRALRGADQSDTERPQPRSPLAGDTQDFDPAVPEEEDVPPHRAVTVLARPAAAAAAAGAAPPLDAVIAQLAHGDTLSERELGALPRTARGSTSPSLLSSSGVARYETHGELGRGGMGRVLEAVDRRLGRVVAVKESFATDPDGRQRFDREVSITARLEHPSIVPLYDSGVTDDGRAFYVMRKLSGRGLDLVMSELTTLDERLALLPNLLAACDAVAHAHARRVVHRDLKPGNILIGDHGETLVIDWGLAKAIGELEPPPSAAAVELPPPVSKPPSAPVPPSGAGPGSRPVQAPLPPDDLKTVVGSVFGTPGFMSPEQARGEQLDMRGDVYALGATLYHVLSGRPPHVGRSATEVIDRVRVEPPPPLSQVCPGAPVELAAIVEKAMAFDIDARYPEAAELAGDLRRFLAGQLVAAHRYTFWQRVRRAARTHRAAFLVAGASLLVVSALAAVSILRIVAERDQANRAHGIALQETRIAKAARDEAAARADELVVAQAQGLVEKNPTAAVGLLKRLPAGSPAWPKARMVATAAVAEGITRAIPDGARRPPSIFAMSPRADLLLIGDDLGKVWTLELETLRRKEILNAGGRPLGCWVNGGAAIVLATEATGLVIRDLDSGRDRPVPLPQPVVALACQPTGQAALLDKSGALWFLDPALGQTRAVETGVAADSLELAPDGNHLAVGGKQEAVILDRDGAVRRRIPGEAIRITTSAKGRFAFFMRDRDTELNRVVELDPAATAPPREFPLHKLAVSLFFVGEHLRVLLAGNRLVSPDGNVNTDLPSTPVGFAALGDRTTALGLSDGSVWLSGWWGSRLMHTPATDQIIRLSARPGGARLAGWARGTIMVWNLGGAIPRSLPADHAVSRLVFLGEDRLAAVSHSHWRWMDLERGTVDTVEQDDLPLFTDIAVDERDGNALLIDTMMGRASLMHWDTKTLVGTWRDRVRTATMLGGGALVIGTSDGRVAVGNPVDGPLQILRMESQVIAVSRYGEHGAAALDADGELLIYDLKTKATTRGTVGEPSSAMLVDDGAGGLMVAIGERLVRWTPAGVEEVARLAEPIARLTRFEHHLAVLTETELSTIDLRDKTYPVRRIAGASREQQLRDGNRWSIGVGQRGLIDLVDIATGMRWAKSIHGGLAMFAVSPSGSRVAQRLSSEIALWTYPVPEEPERLRAWIDETTNATVSEALDVVWSLPAP